MMENFLLALLVCLWYGPSKVAATEDVKTKVDAVCLNRGANVNDLNECIAMCETERAHCCLVNSGCFSSHVDGYCDALTGCLVLYAGESFATPLPSLKPTAAPSTRTPTPRPTMITPVPTPRSTPLPTPRPTTTPGPTPLPTPRPTVTPGPTPLPTPRPLCSDYSSCQNCLRAEECVWGNSSCISTCPEGESCVTLDLLSYASGQSSNFEVKQDLLDTFCDRFVNKIKEDEPQPVQCSEQASCTDCLGADCGWGGDACVSSCDAGGACVTLDVLSYGQIANDGVRQEIMTTFCSQFGNDDFASTGGGEDGGSVGDYQITKPIRCAEQSDCEQCLGGGQCVWDISSGSTCVESCPQGDSCVSLDLLTGGRATSEEIKDGMLSTFCTQFKEGIAANIADEQPTINASPGNGGADDLDNERPPMTENLVNDNNQQQVGDLGSDGNEDAPTDDFLGDSSGGLDDDGISQGEQPVIECATQASCKDCLAASCGFQQDTCVDSCPPGDTCISWDLLTGGLFTGKEDKDDILSSFCTQYDNDIVFGSNNLNRPPDENSDNLNRPPDENSKNDGPPSDEPPLHNSENDGPSPQCLEATTCSKCLEEDCGWGLGICVASCPPGVPCVTLDLLSFGQSSNDKLRGDLLKTFCAQFDDSGDVDAQSHSNNQEGGVEAVQPLLHCPQQNSCRECLGTGVCGWGHETCVASCPPGDSCATLDVLAYVTNAEVRDTLLDKFCDEMGDGTLSSVSDSQPNQGESTNWVANTIPPATIFASSAPKLCVPWVLLLAFVNAVAM